MFRGSKRLLCVGIVVGWLLAIVVDQVAGYDYRLIEGDFISGESRRGPEIARDSVNDGWEVVRSQSTPRPEYYLRRHRWMGWIEKLQCNERWCF
jgi:hypothetical protein